MHGEVPSAIPNRTASHMDPSAAASPVMTATPVDEGGSAGNRVRLKNMLRMVLSSAAHIRQFVPRPCRAYRCRRCTTGLERECSCRALLAGTRQAVWIRRLDGPAHHSLASPRQGARRPGGSQEHDERREARTWRARRARHGALDRGCRPIGRSRQGWARPRPDRASSRNRSTPACPRRAGRTLAVPCR